MATVTVVPTSGTMANTGWPDAPGGNPYTKVNTNDGNTSFIYTPTSGSQVSYPMTSSGLVSETINSVTFYNVVSKPDPVDALTRVLVRVGGTNYTSGNFSPSIVNTYETASWMLTTNPSNGLAWTVSDFTSWQVGVHKENGVGENCTYIYAVIDYTGGGGGGSANSGFLGFM